MSVKKNPVSPRQKMINLMYLVLMAMLALNVSTDVLKGLVLVGDSLERSKENAEKETQAIFEDFEHLMKANPDKVGPWFDKAQKVKEASDSLCNFAESLKWAIARAADGSDGNPTNLRNKDDLQASDDVMLNSLDHNGHKLYEDLNNFRKLVEQYITDPRRRAMITANLATIVPDTPEHKGKKWEEYMFEGMPAVAAITMLSKLQSDIRVAEREVLHSFSNNIYVDAVHVNNLEALVCPEQTTLYVGEEFRSRIFMAATDTTKVAEVYVNGQKISPDGHYNFRASEPGEHSFSGYILMPNSAGEMLRRDFTQRYTVLGQKVAPEEPKKGEAQAPAPGPAEGTGGAPKAPIAAGATIAADLMNVLYAGFDNPISVTAAGISQDNVSLTMSGGGTLTSKGGGKYTARPERVGQEITFTVTGTVGGRTLNMGSFTFKVRKLPDPTPYIAVGDDMFKGGRLGKASALGARSLGAAIDDGILHIPFSVLSFECVFFDRMGNVIIERSAGSSFTEAQREIMRQLNRGKRFYISNVRAVGPDKIERTLPGALEVIVN